MTGTRGKALLGATALLALAACAARPPVLPTSEQAPHGIVLLIGDGMGVAHFTLARLLRGDDFAIGRLPQTGLVATDSADQRVPDSASSATAYATGVKTNTHYLGVDAAGRSHRTVVELAEARGLGTGLVTTAPLGDATVAAFVVHANDRYDTPAVARQFVAAGVDILVSGGLAKLGQGPVPTLEALAGLGGYRAVRSAQELRSAGTEPVLAVLPSGPLDGDSPEIALPELAEWALARLAGQPRGFFLLLEHEGTDTASHQNNRLALEASLRSFDETVAVVMDTARERGDLLVIVVGDHETGGLRIVGTWDEPADAWGSLDHTGAAVPIFAYGPGAAAFGGFQDNTAIGRTLLALVRRMGE